MCGVFGAIGGRSRAELELAARAAVVALHHRGPDCSGVWFADGRPDGEGVAVALAHTRLRVIDLSEAARQPMTGCDPRIQLTFNGEIYNHRALRAELEALGHRFRSRSDTEALLHGYEAWGDAVVERLDGMFAFGLWDGGRQRLLCARDRSGKKPLFFGFDPAAADRFDFASEIKALRAAGRRAALDPRALPMLLSFGYVPAPDTLHLGVQALPPASRLSWRPGEAPRIDRYWEPTFLDPPLAVGAAEAAARVRELVIAAVHKRLEADVPLGAFLSGGLDSSIVVGVLSRHLGRRVKTFSIGFAGDAAYDETGYARLAAQAFGSDHTELTLAPSPVELADLIDHLVWLHDGPFGDSSAVPTHTVARLTRRHVTVALTGDGGDELFAGYLRFLAAEAAERLPLFVRRSMAGAAAHLPGILPGRLPEKSLLHRARRFLGKAGLPMAERVAGWGSLFAGELAGVFQPEVARAVDTAAPMAWQRRFFVGPGTALAHLLDHNFRAYLACDLQTKVDRCTAGVGLEARSPFLDTALMEYAGRLPDHLKRRGTTTKWILRRAFADLVPRPILTRGKMGFGLPLATWFRGPLRAPLGDLLGPGARLSEWLQPAAVARLVARHQAGEDHSARLWLLLTLEVWLRAQGAAAGAAAHPSASASASAPAPAPASAPALRLDEPPATAPTPAPGLS